MNLILCDDDKAFLDKLEIRIRGLCQKYKIAVEMECYVSAKEMLEGIKNLDEISVFFIDIDMPEVNGFEAASYLKKWNRECCIVFVSNKDDLVFQSLVYASLRTIAAKAETTTGSIYSRFRDKEGLFGALVEPAAGGRTLEILNESDCEYSLNGNKQTNN